MLLVALLFQQQVSTVLVADLNERRFVEACMAHLLYLRLVHLAVLH
jgi:hypothetical protein